MDNYVAIVFDDDAKAYDALHTLWNLDANGEITVRGAAVIHRDSHGHIDVATKDTDPGVRTAIGVGIGVLLGALAGPIGAAAGATIAAGTAVGVGAAAGGLAGLTADAIKSDEHEQAAYETSFVLARNKSAVIAEVAEERTGPINAMGKRLGGTVYRRKKSDIRDDSWLEADYADYLYPYDYQPVFA
ncbi:MAG: hypothetical protein JO092_09430 [Candidatus Eremiobacteraeota bacterium]|nr:hypothetical protein [Candidatus Eremiobacteraeota bacterium]